MRSNTIAGVGKSLFLWNLCNRGKRAPTLDLALPEGREIAVRLVETTDVFLTNFLPPARRRLVSLGLDRRSLPTSYATAARSAGISSFKAWMDGTPADLGVSRGAAVA